jgi:biopolymer transport protein ExbD
VKIDLPVNSDQNNPPPIDPIKNTVSVDPAGTVTWNGSPIDMVTLRLYLERTRAMTPEPELHVQRDALARYAVVDNVLAIIKRSGVTKMGFVGNEQYRAF